MYVTNRNDATVTVIDAAFADVLGDPIAVGAAPVGVAVSPDGTRIYVTNQDNFNVQVITLQTLNPVSGAVSGLLNVVDDDGEELTYTVVSGPQEGTVTIDPETGSYTYTPSQALRLFVAEFLPTVLQKTFTVEISDGVNEPRLVDISVPIVPARVFALLDSTLVGNAPSGVAVSPDGTRAYVANFVDDTLTVLDISSTTTAKPTVLGDPIPVRDRPTDVTLSPDGSRAYIGSHFGDGTITVLDTTTATPTVLGTIDVGGQPTAVAFSPDGGRAYIANIDGTVSVLDTTTALPTVVGDPIPVGAQATGVAVSPDGTRLYVSDFNGGTNGTFAVFDLTTATPTIIGAAVPVGGPTALVISSDGTRAYVLNQFDDNVVALDITTDTPTIVNGPLPVGFDPTGLAISPDGSVLYVTARDGTVTVIDAVFVDYLGDPIAVGAAPVGVAVSPDGTRIYVTNEVNDNVQVITLQTLNL